MIKLYFKFAGKEDWIKVREYKDLHELFDAFPLIASLFHNEPFMTFLEWDYGQGGDRRIVWEGRLTQ